LRDVIVAMVRLEILQLSLDVGRSIGIVHMVVVPSCWLMAESLEAPSSLSVQRRVF
jgi:hypothetical protein